MTTNTTSEQEIERLCKEYRVLRAELEAAGRRHDEAVLPPTKPVCMAGEPTGADTTRAPVPSPASASFIRLSA